jgi:HEAT repeat protein
MNAGRQFFVARTDITAMRRRRDVDGLIRALGNPDEVIRLGAAQALGAVGDARAVEPLERLKFFDPSPDVRRAASLAHTRIAERLAAERTVRGA